MFADLFTVTKIAETKQNIGGLLFQVIGCVELFQLFGNFFQEGGKVKKNPKFGSQKNQLFCDKKTITFLRLNLFQQNKVQ